MSAFSENSLFEQGRLEDPYYATGSNFSTGNNPGSFSSALRDKTQIRVSFPVNNKIKMLPNSSSIYYFNIKKGQWNIPTAATGDLSGLSDNVVMDTASVLENVSLGYQISIGTTGSIFVEDEKWFDTHGNSLGSGSIGLFDLTRLLNGQDRRQRIYEESFPQFNVINSSNWSSLLTLDMPKSVQRNNSYNITSDDFFTLPVEEPFLIEKIVFEIPFCFGNGWFNDRTALTLMSSSGGEYVIAVGGEDVPVDTLVSGEVPFTIGDSTFVFAEIGSSGSSSAYNYGGPGITLSLFSQKNYGTGSIRDLICRGFVTHEEDSKRSIKFVPVVDGKIQNYGDLGKTWIQLTTLGVDQRDTKVDAIVSASYSGNNRFFTGSIVIKSDVEISNGIRLLHTRSFFGYPEFTGETYKYNFRSYQEGIDFVSGCFENSYISLDESMLSGVDSFGRGMTGFLPSGGSIFGGEYVTIDSETLRKDNKIKNPSVVSGSMKTNALSLFSSSHTSYNSNQSIFGSNQYISYNIKAPCYYFLGSRKQSPYLVYPGDKLSIGISKNRPAYSSFKAKFTSLANFLSGKAQILSSSYLMDLQSTEGHDVQLNTGSINITFYGSYVRQGNKYVP